MGKRIRRLAQGGWGFLTNAYIRGFLPGGPMLYSGGLKHFCVPGMNCYSCPGALGACPVGALQAALAGRQRRFPFYVLGYLASVGLVAGRLVCGWLCLFGLLQELLYRIPVRKLRIPEQADRALRSMKYLVLAVLVAGLPLFYRSEYGTGDPFFCKYVCPVGTLEGGVPLVLLNSALRPALGWLFRWKLLLLCLCLLASAMIYRPFCKYICPLGAFYSLFQRRSLIRIRVDAAACANCGACSRACGMQVDPHTAPNSTECIRCGECIAACPVGALSFVHPGRDREAAAGSAAVEKGKGNS